MLFGMNLTYQGTTNGLNPKRFANDHNFLGFPPGIYGEWYFTNSSKT